MHPLLFTFDFVLCFCSHMYVDFITQVISLFAMFTHYTYSNLNTHINSYYFLAHTFATYMHVLYYYLWLHIQVGHYWKISIV